MLDELLMLFYIATANNPHLDLVSVLNQKFTSYVPASVMVSCEFNANRPKCFQNTLEKQITIDTKLDLPTFRFVIQKLLLESRSR